MTPVILLADLDCFFVEVERLHRPELRNKPVIIGGPPGRRGVVAACSYEARALGVHSAMPMAEAYRQAQGHDVHFLHDGLHGNYTLYSNRVRGILSSEAPVFHAKSIDEFELDISGCERLFERDYGGIPSFAEHLRRRVRTEVGLPLSIGIGPSRLVAKMASRHAKPDGVYRVTPREAYAFLAPHDVQDVPGIGPATAGALRNMGINRVEQLLAQPKGLLRQTCGIGLVALAENLAGSEGLTASAGYFGHGDEDSAGQAQRASPPKSIGHETTFERDILDPEALERTLWRLTEDACCRLRAADLRTRHVTVKIRYSDFGTQTHGGFLNEPTDADSAVFERVKELFHEGHTRRLRIRLLGVRLTRLSAGASQPLLFETPQGQREHRLFATVDHIRERHGRDSVLVGPGLARLTNPRQLAANSTAGIPSAFMHNQG